MPTATVTPPTADVGWLLRELAAARLLDSDEARPLLDEFRTAGTASDAAGFADFLVQAGLLTSYQAEQALTGQARTLTVGPYILLEPVGSGSLGTVYRTVHTNDRKRYAVKLLPLRSMWNVLQAKRQVAVFSDLPPHPAVVPFVDIDTAGKSHYLAWPFVEGRPFDVLIRRHGPLSPAHAVRFLSEVADGLAACHSHGIVHGLLKPSNLLLGPDHRAKILDLGIGAILSENVADEESLLDTISTANTAITVLDFAPPETLNDPTNRTPAGDMYGFGCVMYFLLTGTCPFPDGNAVDKIVAHRSQEPIPVQERNAAVPDALGRLLEHLMRKEPAERPSEMASVRAALLEAVPGAQLEGSFSFPVRFATSEAPTAPPPVPTPPGDESAGLVSFDLPELRETFFELPADPEPPRESPPPETARPPKPEKPFVFKPQSLLRDSTPLTPRGEPPPPVRSEAPAARRPGFWRRLLERLSPSGPPADEVQFSVFGPMRYNPGQTWRLQVYAHPPAAFHSVRMLSRAFQPDMELLGGAFADRPIVRDELLQMSLVVTNAGVARTAMQIRWAGQTRPVAFQVYVPWESPAGRAPAVLRVESAGVELAQIAFEIVVLPRGG